MAGHTLVIFTGSRPIRLVSTARLQTPAHRIMLKRRTHSCVLPIVMPLDIHVCSIVRLWVPVLQVGGSEARGVGGRQFGPSVLAPRAHVDVDGSQPQWEPNGP